MSQAARKHYTPAEYLALEERAAYKSEYFKGEIFAMAGGSYNHTVISVNMLVALSNGLATRPCVVFNSDMRLLVQANGLYTYPDVSVVCGDPAFVEGRTDTVTNPQLIVEVLSESTGFYDRNGKFALYRELPSLHEYVLIDQNRVLVEYYRRLNNDEWLLKTFNDLEAVVRLGDLGVEISLKQIYNRVIFKDGDNKL